jgi:hypothetical protein
MMIFTLLILDSEFTKIGCVDSDINNVFSTARHWLSVGKRVVIQKWDKAHSIDYILGYLWSEEDFAIFDAEDEITNRILEKSILNIDGATLCLKPI